MDEQLLRNKLRKIEALFAKASTDGEAKAARSAILRIKEKLDESSKSKLTEFRYNLETYRYYRQHHTTVMIKAQREFVENILSPEFEELEDVLFEYFNVKIETIIREEFHNDCSEVKCIN
jgi:hypothetical protein